MGLSRREGEWGVDYFRRLPRESDEKEFDFRGIESKKIRRHLRWDDSDGGLKVAYGKLEIFRNKGYKELYIVST